jgi:Lrp/AsnC family transcriptional regulator, leucine-responsive regulatory protein
MEHLPSYYESGHVGQPRLCEGLAGLTWPSYSGHRYCSGTAFAVPYGGWFLSEDKPQRRPRSAALDDVDQRIIAVLARDGRAQSTSIGEELGLSGNLVANRIRAMDAAGLMRVVAIGDFRVHGYQMLARIRLQLAGRSPFDVADELASREEVLAVHISSGRYAVSCLYAFHNAEEMLDAARELSVEIDGVEDIDVELINQVYRYMPAVGPLVTR